SAMDSLPNEILLDILEYFTRRDLKTVLPLVSRRFHNILKKQSPDSSTRIDRIMYRDSPVTPYPKNVKRPRVNPIFWARQLRYDYRPVLEAVIFFGKSLSEIPAGEENAVSPAVRKAVYHHPFTGIGSFIEIDGTGKNGGAVTVLDIMKGVVEITRQCE